VFEIITRPRMNTFRGALRRGHQWRSCDRV